MAKNNTDRGYGNLSGGALPSIKTVSDVGSDSVPSIEEMRESQAAGRRSKGTNPDDTCLNEAQGHGANVQD